MTPIEYIRTKVFGISQAAFAGLAEVSQPTVSRWESGNWEPNRDELERIRSAALERGIDWHDQWFFDEPPSDNEPERAA